MRSRVHFSGLRDSKRVRCGKVISNICAQDFHNLDVVIRTIACDAFEGVDGTDTDFDVWFSIFQAFSVNDWGIVRTDGRYQVATIISFPVIAFALIARRVDHFADDLFGSQSCNSGIDPVGDQAGFGGGGLTFSGEDTDQRQWGADQPGQRTDQADQSQEMQAVGDRIIVGAFEPDAPDQQDGHDQYRSPDRRKNKSEPAKAVEAGAFVEAVGLYGRHLWLDLDDYPQHQRQPGRK